MVTINDYFTFYEPHKDEDFPEKFNFDGFSLNIPAISFHVIEKSEFSSHELLKRPEHFFVSEGGKPSDPKTIKGFFSKDEALAYAEKEFQKNLNQLIHNLQELIA